MNIITAELIQIADLSLRDPDDWTTETSFDTIEITFPDGRVEHARIESSEDSEPYDAAVRYVVGDAPFEWIE